ncbi:MAG: hypothetical protein R6V44_14435 [Paracoccaceae bacterium]
MMTKASGPDASTDPENAQDAEDREALRRFLDWAEREAAGQGRRDAAMLLAAARRALE